MHVIWENDIWKQYKFDAIENHMESIYMECNCIGNTLKITIILLMASVTHLDSRESKLDTRTPTLDSKLSIKRHSKH